MGDPGPTGRFGDFGGRYIPETLVLACAELDQAFRDAWADPAFRAELDGLLRDYAGRPSRLYEAKRLSAELGCTLLLKREDLNHTGSHKINNVLGQALLAKRMGKPRVVAETGAGQHGVAAATAAALLGLECVVYMGEVDMERQALNVFRMRLLGAEVRPATSGSRTLKDAINEAMRDWVATVESSHYLLGSVMGPHPYPWMVRELHRVIGDEAREQCRELLGRDPDVVTACVGGGSNAIGLFSGFAELPDVELVGVEPAGGAAVAHGVPGHRARLEVVPAPGRARAGGGGGVDLGRASTTRASARSTPTSPPPAGLATRRSTDAEVLDAFGVLARTEGIIPALESAHALAWVLRAERRAGRPDRDPQPVRAAATRTSPRSRRSSVAERTALEAHLRARTRRRPQAARARTSPAGWATTGPRSCGPSRPPAPTPSRSASRSPTR